MTQPFAINSLNLVIRWCPICERFHHRKVRVTRLSPKDYAACPSCGWKWHPNGCHCKECRKKEVEREAKKQAREVEGNADIQRQAH